MQFKILLSGSIALLLWVYVLKRASTKRIAWASPVSLFALGIMMFYIVPALYWQIRDWEYQIPPYFEGLPVVLWSAAIMAVPFVVLVRSSATHGRPPSLAAMPIGERANLQMWLLVIPVLAGAAWRYYLLTLGYQSRLERDVPTLFNSEQLAFLAGNIAFYYPACYFALFAFGNRAQRRLGKIFWMCDALLSIYTLHRYEILLYLFRSAIFLTMLGFRPNVRQKAAMAFAVLFVIAVVGQSHLFSYSHTSGSRQFLTAGEVAEVLSESASAYMSGDSETGFSSSDSNIVLRLLDDTMYRLYDSRSASAVVYNVPEYIPYFHGRTFLHIFYALIPRYIWSDKPEIGSINAITTWVMPNDSGVNPLGTLAEFYLNFSFIGVFAGGILCAIICFGTDKIINSHSAIKPGWFCVYPIVAELFLAMNSTFTQRISEGLRGLLVLLALSFLFKLNAAVEVHAAHPRIPIPKERSSSRTARLRQAG